MANKKFVRNLFIVLAVSILTVIVFFIFFNNRSLIKLDGVEVRNYQGQKLSSVQDFRENSIHGPQNIDINSYQLLLTGLVKNEKKYSYDDVIKKHQNYSKVVTLNCVEGWSVTILWQGVLLKDLFNEAGIDPKANTVIFYAVDGYTSSLPLDFVLNKNILLAYKMNNVTIPPVRGFPFMVVAQDKYGFKWVKWVTKIELSSDSNYQGYWESRGFSNDTYLKQ